MVASAPANALLADTARQSARALRPITPAGVRLENMSQFLNCVGDDLVRSAGPRRPPSTPPADGLPGQG
ncbi:hypothetical protein GCM10020219_038700 [Nonomuraea dietziae]